MHTCRCGLCCNALVRNRVLRRQDLSPYLSEKDSCSLARLDHCDGCDALTRGAGPSQAEGDRLVRVMLVAHEICAAAASQPDSPAYCVTALAPRTFNETGRKKESLDDVHDARYV